MGRTDAFGAASIKTLYSPSTNACAPKIILVVAIVQEHDCRARRVWGRSAISAWRAWLKPQKACRSGQRVNGYAEALASAAARSAEARPPGSSPPIFIIGRGQGDARKVPRGTPGGAASCADAGLTRTTEAARNYSPPNPPGDGLWASSHDAVPGAEKDFASEVIATNDSANMAEIVEAVDSNGCRVPYRK